MNALCARCQRPLPVGHVAGNCPACLFGSALHDEPLESAVEDLGDEPPGELGDYEILGEIGRGGTSVVYRARQRRLNRIVALKTLHGSAVSSRDAFERLQTEAQAVARLDHPHIVPLYEVGRHAGTYFLALRYFEHGSLAHALKERRFRPAEAVRLLATAARAVHHAHSRGVLHRDIKPSNLLLDEHGAPHIADFGLAKLADSESSLTLSTSVLGTPAYMAPEQAAGNAKAAGTPADIYALGAVLFELLTGRPPFLGRSALEVLRLVADSEPPRPTSLVPDLDRDLEAVCLRCLEKDPSRRYDSAAALAEDLERWLRSEPLSVRPLSPSARVLKWVRRRPAVAALTGGCALLFVFGVAGVLWQGRKAVQAAGLARTNEAVARRNAYVAEMTLANQAFQSRNWSTIRKILERTTPDSGSPDLRGWEWRFLWGVSRSDAKPFRDQRPGTVYAMAPLPDGKHLAVGRGEGGFELWDIPAGGVVYSLPDPINQVVDEDHFAGNIVSCRLAAVPGTGMLAYTDCRSPTNAFVRLWDTETRRVVRSLPLPWIPRHLAASPDGRWVACSTMGFDNRVLIFETATGRLLRTIQSRRFPDWSEGHSLVFAADSTAVTVEEFTVERRCGLRMVDVVSGADRGWFPLERDYVTSASISPDGRWLAASGGFTRSNLRVWDLTTGRLVPTPDISSVSVRFDPTGRRLLVGLDVLKVPEFTLERRLEGEMAVFFAAACALDGRTYVTPAGGGQLLKWDLESPSRLRSGKQLGLPVQGITWLPGERGAFIVATNGTCHEAVVPDFATHPLPLLGNDARRCSLLERAGRVAVAREGGRITLHQLSDYATKGTLVTGTNPIVRLGSLDKLGLLFAVCGESATNRSLQFWDPGDGEKIWEVLLAPADRSLAVSTHEGLIHQVFSDHLIAYDPSRKRVFRRDLDHSGAGRLSFSPDGRWAFSSDRGYMGLLDAVTLRTVDKLGSIEGATHGSAFWPQEHRLLLSGGRVVDLDSRQLLLNVGAGFGFIHHPVISRDGELIAEFVNASPWLVLWRAPSWEEIRQAEQSVPRHNAAHR